jgi:hypothetical protein
MYLESDAPPLVHWDEFKSFMEARGVRVLRDYIPPIEIDGEMAGDFWTVLIMKEQLLTDDRLYTQVIDIGEQIVSEGNHEIWDVEVELLTFALEQGIAKEMA